MASTSERSSSDELELLSSSSSFAPSRGSCRPNSGSPPDPARRSDSRSAVGLAEDRPAIFRRWLEPPFFIAATAAAVGSSSSSTAAVSSRNALPVIMTLFETDPAGDLASSSSAAAAATAAATAPAAWARALATCCASVAAAVFFAAVAARVMLIRRGRGVLRGRWGLLLSSEGPVTDSAATRCAGAGGGGGGGVAAAGAGSSAPVFLDFDPTGRPRFDLAAGARSAGVLSRFPPEVPCLSFFFDFDPLGLPRFLRGVAGAPIESQQQQQQQLQQRQRQQLLGYSRRFLRVCRHHRYHLGYPRREATRHVSFA
ncbi:unnamed protein product [Ectocarpus sp. 13 AM-2016]